MTDAEITKVARELTANPQCRRTSYPKGVYELRADEPKVCKAEFIYKDGKIFVCKECGELCSFITETGREFTQNVFLVRGVENALSAVGLRIVPK